MGEVSLYYYYYMMSKVLSAIQLDEIVMPQGQRINWKNTLAQELLSRQQSDGSWVNREKRYMEGHPVIATAYALNTLNLINKGLSI